MEMVFYEKPGCAGNTRQKHQLLRAGIDLEVRDLLSTPWDVAALTPFLAGREIGEWFNPNAPDIKSGVVNPELLTKEEALALLVSEPILIKRPLILYKGEHILGFDLGRLCTLIPTLGRFSPVDPGNCTGQDRCGQ